MIHELRQQKQQALIKPQMRKMSSHHSSDKPRKKA